MQSRSAAVDEYIARFPKETQKLLSQVRATIRKAAPTAEEVISYQVPAFKLGGILVYFAAFEKHIGFYPTPSAIAAFKKDLTPYKWAKGSVQFPLDEQVPLGLIAKMVKFRVKENEQKSRAMKK